MNLRTAGSSTTRSADTLDRRRRSLAPLVIVTVAALVFAILLVLVRLQWAPLEAADHGPAADINSLIAGNATLVTVVKDLRDVERLRRARDLLAVKGFDTRDALINCYSDAGFSDGLRAAQDHDIRLVGLGQLYAPSAVNPSRGGLDRFRGSCTGC